jgi:hypothetical protein
MCLTEDQLVKVLVDYMRVKGAGNATRRFGLACRTIADSGGAGNWDNIHWLDAARRVEKSGNNFSPYRTTDGWQL